MIGAYIGLGLQEGRGKVGGGGPLLLWVPKKVDVIQCNEQKNLVFQLITTDISCNCRGNKCFLSFHNEAEVLTKMKMEVALQRTQS